MSWVIADIGGTHARFACCDKGGLKSESIQTLMTGDYRGVVEATHHYLELSGLSHTRRMAIALPCPVESDPVILTNAGWKLRRQTIIEQLQLQQLHLVNDFYAQALALSVLRERDYLAVGGSEVKAGNKAVLGPGTGLGTAGLIRGQDEYHVVSGEGGHCTLAASNDREAEIIRVARDRLGHVSAERLLSGIGISELEHSMMRVEGVNDYAPRASRQIITAAADGEIRAQRTVQQMVQFLATVGSNLALIYGATGGVYLTGGILPRVSHVIDWTQYHQRFIDKGRFKSYLEPIPNVLITHQQPGLLGLSAMVQSAE